MIGTISYFNVYGRAECIRWLLVHAKAEFVDDQITFD